MTALEKHIELLERAVAYDGTGREMRFVGGDKPVLTEKGKLIKLLCVAHSKSTEAACFEDATYAKQLRMEADYLIANGVTLDNQVSSSKWIPVSERLPKSGVHVLVCCEVGFGSGRYVCDGYFADRFTEKASYHGEDIACEYCEDDDEYYLWQGWYEVIKNWDDYNSIAIGDVVTHWMPLPEPPKGE